MILRQTYLWFLDRYMFLCETYPPFGGAERPLAATHASWKTRDERVERRIFLR